MIKQVIDVQHIFFLFFRFRINLYNCKANKCDSIIITLLKNVASKYFALCSSITISVRTISNQVKSTEGNKQRGDRQK